jgi:hypothetical protein
MGYLSSPLVGEALEGPVDGPQPGERAPDAHGLVRFGVEHEERLFELLADPRPALLLYADATVPEADVLALEDVAEAARSASGGDVAVHLVLSPDAAVPALLDLPVHRDARGAFREQYGTSGAAAYLVRPDGHVGFRSLPVSGSALLEHLGLVYA